MFILSFLQCVLYLLLIPAAIGISFTRHFDEKYNTVGNVLVCGFLSELSVFEILFLIFYYLDRKLVELTWCASVVLVVLAIVSFILSFKYFKKIKLPKFDWAFAVFVLFNVYMIVMRNLQGINDADDAFVLGNALTTYTTGYFYKTDYYTGHQIMGTGYLRHLLAANPIFIAYMAKVTFVHPTILAHRILSSFYLCLHSAIIYNISILLFDDEKKEKYRSIFASFITLVTIWDFHSYLTDSTFILSRTWQGKAMFCAFSVPFAVLLLLMIGECEGKKNVYFALIAVLCAASVSMTPAAVYLLTIMLFVGSICVAVAVKKVKVSFKTILSLIPMAGFAAVYMLFVH